MSSLCRVIAGASSIADCASLLATSVITMSRLLPELISVIQSSPAAFSDKVNRRSATACSGLTMRAPRAASWASSKRRTVPASSLESDDALLRSIETAEAWPARAKVFATRSAAASVHVDFAGWERSACGKASTATNTENRSDHRRSHFADTDILGWASRIIALCNWVIWQLSNFVIGNSKRRCAVSCSCLISRLHNYSISQFFQPRAAGWHAPGLVLEPKAQAQLYGHRRLQISSADGCLLRLASCHPQN